MSVKMSTKGTLCIHNNASLGQAIYLNKLKLKVFFWISPASRILVTLISCFFSIQFFK